MSRHRRRTAKDIPREKITDFLTRGERLRERNEKKMATSTSDPSNTKEAGMSHQDQPESGGLCTKPVIQMSPIDPKDISTLVTAIKEMGTQVGEKLGKLDSLEKKIDSMVSWKKSVDDRVKKVEDSLKEQTKNFAGYATAIEYTEKTAKNIDTQFESIDQRFNALTLVMIKNRCKEIEAKARQDHKINLLEREIRQYNIRAQGVQLEHNESPKNAAFRIFSKVSSDLKKEHIRFVIKKRLKSSVAVRQEPDQGENETESQEGDSETVETETESNRPYFIFTVRFNDLSMRNKIFFLGKKHKDRLPHGVILRDDMTSPDYIKWQKAKPQMAAAFTAKQRSSCRWGDLKIDGVSTKIQGLEPVYMGPDKKITNYPDMDSLSEQQLYELACKKTPSQKSLDSATNT